MSGANKKDPLTHWKVIETTIKTLPERMQEILRMRYALGGRESWLSQTAVGKMLWNKKTGRAGMTRQAVSQLEKEALDILLSNAKKVLRTLDRKQLMTYLIGQRAKADVKKVKGLDRVRLMNSK